MFQRYVFLLPGNRIGSVVYDWANYLSYEDHKKKLEADPKATHTLKTRVYKVEILASSYPKRGAAQVITNEDLDKIIAARAHVQKLTEVQDCQTVVDNWEW